ncbi:MAG: hypothetical protein IJF63_02230, partial [Alistipes sp.]|nr:hypothetical protein [Alistipes sp.]
LCALDYGVNPHHLFLRTLRRAAKSTAEETKINPHTQPHCQFRHFILMKNQELKKFLIATAIVVVSVCIIDKAVGILGNHSMRLIPDFSGHLAKDNFTMNRLTDVDVLIVGSSRASHHYDAQLLIDSINNYTQSSYSIYNAGIDGNFLNHNACRLESILDRYQPKLVIFEIGESELSESGGGPVLYIPNGPILSIVKTSRSLSQPTGLENAHTATVCHVSIQQQTFAYTEFVFNTFSSQQWL